MVKDLAACGRLAEGRTSGGKKIETVLYTSTIISKILEAAGAPFQSYGGLCP